MELKRFAKLPKLHVWPLRINTRLSLLSPLSSRSLRWKVHRRHLVSLHPSRRVPLSLSLRPQENPPQKKPRLTPKARVRNQPPRRALARREKNHLVKNFKQ